MERQQRKLQIEAYKHQRIVNDALIKRLSLLISTMQSQHTTSVLDDPSVFAFKAIMESALRSPEEDTPPKQPDGLTDVDSPPLPTYSKMMVTILDEANKALAGRQIEDGLRFEALVEELHGHVGAIQEVQTNLAKKLDDLEQQSARKITSENYHVGFDSSYVSKADETEKKSTDTKVELLNPNVHSGKGDFATSGTTTAGSHLGAEEKELPRASPAAREFAQINTSNYRASREYLSSHPGLLQESETNGLLHDAYSLVLDHDDEARARQCVHQALLLQYCRLLGRDGAGVALFFKRIATPGHQALELFEKDVAQTFQKIMAMAKRDATRKNVPVERLQLYSPSGEEGSVRIQVPPAASEDEEVRKARVVFENIAPEMRAALEHGSLDEINEVLGGMEYTEAEQLSSLLDEVRFMPARWRCLVASC